MKSRSTLVALAVSLVHSAALIGAALILAGLQIPVLFPSRVESEALRPENVLVGLLAYIAWWVIPGTTVCSALGLGAGAALGHLAPSERSIGWIVLWCSVVPFLLLLIAASLVPANGGWVIVQGTGLGVGLVASALFGVRGRRLAGDRA